MIFFQDRPKVPPFGRENIQEKYAFYHSQFKSDSRTDGCRTSKEPYPRVKNFFKKPNLFVSDTMNIKKNQHYTNKMLNIGLNFIF